MKHCTDLAHAHTHKHAGVEIRRLSVSSFILSSCQTLFFVLFFYFTDSAGVRLKPTTPHQVCDPNGDRKWTLCCQLWSPAGSGVGPLTAPVVFGLAQT